MQKSFLMKDVAFPLIVAVACAGIMGGTSLFLTNRVGAFNEIFVVQMLSNGLQTGDYAAAASFAAGFLIARILEGPLVGVLDIGGSLMTGVGIGIPALLIASGYRGLIENFTTAVLFGALTGLVVGLVILLIRKSMPQGLSAAGTDVMMGAGNAMGRYLGPLIIISAITYSIPAGIGAFLGAALFYYLKKPIPGGAILGAMILGTMFPVK